MQLDRINSDGDGTIMYPSGRTAVTVCRSPNGCFHTFCADTDAFQVLCCFDPEGVGSVNYACGRPWLVTTREGWMLSSGSGSIEKCGTWPWGGNGSAAIECTVTPELRVVFAGRDSITAHFSCSGIERQFNVGRQLRRQPGLAMTGTDTQGRLQLDVAAIRKRIASVGSVYMSPGPHHTVTVQPGLGNLRSLAASMAADSPLAATMRELDRGQARLVAFSALRATSAPVRHGAASGMKPALVGQGGSIGAAAEDKPYGSPELSLKQQRIAARLQRIAATAPTYAMRRRKLPLLDMRMLERLTGSAAPQDTLIVAAVLASWNPVCARLEHCELQAAAWELAEQRQADSAGRERECERACASGPERSRAAALIGRDAACIKLFKVDGSSCGELRRRHGAFSVPMFFFWFGGRLVNAGNAVRRRDELLAAAAAALAAGRRGDFLPCDFSFASGMRVDALDSISPNMSLRGPCL